MGGFDGIAVREPEHGSSSARVEMVVCSLGSLATQPAFGLGDLHTLSGAQSDQVGLELGSQTWPGHEVLDAAWR